MRLEFKFCVQASARTWALRYLGNKLCEHSLVRMRMLGELAISQSLINDGVEKECGLPSKLTMLFNQQVNLPV